MICHFDREFKADFEYSKIFQIKLTFLKVILEKKIEILKKYLKIICIN